MTNETDKLHRLLTDKLRCYAAGNARVKGWKNQLNLIADEIEKEVDQNYMPRPLDSEGTPIRIGDFIESTEIGKQFQVTGFCYETAGTKTPRWSIVCDYDGYSGTTEFVSANRCRHVGQEDGVKAPDSIEHSEKEALIDALTAIASAISFCETDMQIVVQDRLNLVYDAIERLNGM